MKRRTDQGFSLLEVMVSLSIIAIALMAIVSTVLHTIRMKESEKEQQIAKQAVTRKVEELKAGTFSTLFATYDGTTFGVADLVHTAGPTGQGLGTVEIDNTNSELLDITVTVQWNGILGDGTYSLRTLQTR